MLPSAYRLTRRSDFGRVYAKGRSYAGDLVVVYVLPTKEQCIRVGFSVSSKLGGAVVRNRTRRRLREALRKLLGQIESGYDLVIVARARAAEASLGQIAAAVEQGFVRARIIRRCDETGRQTSGLCQDAP